MRVMWTTEDSANTFRELVGVQRGHRVPPLCASRGPFRFDGVQQRALLGQSSLPPSSQCPKATVLAEFSRRVVEQFLTYKRSEVSWLLL